MKTINELWNNGTKEDWNEALAAYDKMSTVERNNKLECKMAKLNENTEIVRSMNGEEFYDFLYEKYYVWKYTNKLYLKNNRERLEQQDKNELLAIKNNIFSVYDSNPEDIESLLKIVTRINGLAVIGASGLLSLLFPTLYGTLDKYLIKSLRMISSFSEDTKKALMYMDESDIKIKDAVLLENILQEKSAELNKKFFNG